MLEDRKILMLNSLMLLMGCLKGKVLMKGNIFYRNWNNRWLQRIIWVWVGIYNRYYCWLRKVKIEGMLLMLICCWRMRGIGIRNKILRRSRLSWRCWLPIMLKSSLRRMRLRGRSSLWDFQIIWIIQWSFSFKMKGSFIIKD